MKLPKFQNNSPLAACRDKVRQAARPRVSGGNDRRDLLSPAYAAGKSERAQEPVRESTEVDGESGNRIGFVRTRKTPQEYVFH